MPSNLPIPTDQMKFRVSGDERDEIYLQAGVKCFANIKETLAAIDRPLESFSSVLDFGCGCARVLRNWPSIEGQAVHGTDIDADAIEWCRTALPFFTFNRNEGLPSTRYNDDQFDLIFSVSVFSHLRQDYATAWIHELKRISAPGAILIISLHGSHLRPDLPGLKDGELFETTEFWKGHFPDWYGNLYVSEEAARRLFDPYFNVVKFVHRGIMDHQDVIVLKA
jgi:SAM-dependent methyltransferase